jgi:Icc-related predicted phosphoesterase
VIPVVNSARASAKQDTRASDLDLVYAVGKVLDPNSVVREGEQIMITNAQSPANQIAGYINSLSGGAKFTPELRADLLRLLDNRAQEWQNLYTQRVGEYRILANQNNLDPAQVVFQVPNVDSEYNKDYQRDEYVTTCRYGFKAFRPENIVVVVTDTDVVV